jgi:pimeloyl-ACP methyl ester carboxylesterase
MRNLFALLLFCLVLAPSHQARAQGAGRKVKPLAIDTSFLLSVNGVKQYVEIKGTSKTKPVLLYIHGGPAWPATPMNRRYSHELANDFIFVSWDQRNCGKSQTDTTVALTPDVYVEDAHQLTQYLKKTFHQRKIFVLGHSWGSLVGVGLVQRYPQDYAAYIGMGQFVHPGKASLLARTYVLQRATLAHDTATLRAVTNIPLSEENGFSEGPSGLFRFLALAEKYFASREVPDLPDPTQLYPDYKTLNWMTPVMRTIDAMWPYLNGGKTNLLKCPDFKLPVYFIVGKYDYNTPAELAKRYFDIIKAPKKQLFGFEHSGHAPIWEEPALFHRRLVQIAADNKLK